MKPDRAKELYSDYLEDTLSPAMRLAMDQHFAADPSAREDYEEFAKVFGFLDAFAAEEVDVPHGFRAQIIERAAAKTSSREAASANGLWGWLRAPSGRRLAGGFAGAAAAVIVVGALILPHPTGSVNSGTLGPNITLPTSVATMIQGVSSAPSGSNLAYNFRLHLPDSAATATISAYVLSNNDQITEPELLSQATPALTPPLAASNNETVTIPVTVLQAPSPGTSLNLLVQWSSGAGQPVHSQVIFTPTDPNTPASAPKALSANVDYFDALQAIAADDGVTVIADSTNAPTQSVTPSVGDAQSSALADLNNVAGQVGASVTQLSSGASGLLPNE